MLFPGHDTGREYFLYDTTPMVSTMDGNLNRSSAPTPRPLSAPRQSTHDPYTAGRTSHRTYCRAVSKSLNHEEWHAKQRFLPIATEKGQPKPISYPTALAGAGQTWPASCKQGGATETRG